LAEALVAISKFGTAAERLHAIAIAESLPSVCNHLLVAIATRKSVLLRLEGKISESLTHIRLTMSQDCFPYYDDSTGELDTLFDREKSQNKRHYAECGSLLTSCVECYAEDHVFSWPAPVAASDRYPSHLELDFWRSKTMVVARMYRWKGDFEDAGRNFDICLSFMDKMNSNRPQVLAQKAGVLCELKEASKAENVLREDLDRWKANRPCSKGLRRLQVSYLETMIVLDRFEEASTIRCWNIIVMTRSLTSSMMFS
jgi:tetratricopeptide (TPR) repeat protein